MFNITRQFESSLSHGRRRNCSEGKEILVSRHQSFDIESNLTLRKAAVSKDMRLLFAVTLGGTDHEKASIFRDCPTRNSGPSTAQVAGRNALCLSAATLSKAMQRCGDTFPFKKSLYSSIAIDYVRRNMFSLLHNSSLNASSSNRRTLYMLRNGFSHLKNCTENGNRSHSLPDVNILSRLAESVGLDFRIVIVLRDAEELLLSAARKGRTDPMALVDSAEALYSQLSLLDRRFFHCIHYNNYTKMNRNERFELKAFVHPHIELDRLMFFSRDKGKNVANKKNNLKESDFRHSMNSQTASHFLFQLDSRLARLLDLCNEP